MNMFMMIPTIFHLGFPAASKLCCGPRLALPRISSLQGGAAFRGWLQPWDESSQRFSDLVSYVFLMFSSVSWCFLIFWHFSQFVFPISSPFLAPTQQLSLHITSKAFKADLASQFFRLRNEIADARVDPGRISRCLWNSNEVLKIPCKWTTNSKTRVLMSGKVHPLSWISSLGSLQGGLPAEPAEPSVATAWRFGQCH